MEFPEPIEAHDARIREEVEEIMKEVQMDIIYAIKLICHKEHYNYEDIGYATKYALHLWEFRE